MAPLESERERYYRCALRGLRFVDARRPTTRRLGAEAEARWSRFKGGLRQIDRIELLLRDADAEWPGAFGARGVFALGASANAETFGPEWPSLSSKRAAELWRQEMTDELAPDEGSVSRVLARMAEAWDLSLSKLPTPEARPNDRLLVVGPSALLVVALAFEAGTSLSVSEQVTVVATPPGHRQLALFLSAAFDQRAPVSVVAAAALAGRKPPRGLRLVHAEDADDADLAAALEQVAHVA